MRVVLHEQGVEHFPLEEGFSVAPGMATSVGLTNVSVEINVLKNHEISNLC